MINRFNAFPIKIPRLVHRHWQAKTKNVYIEARITTILKNKTKTEGLTLAGFRGYHKGHQASQSDSGIGQRCRSWEGIESAEINLYICNQCRNDSLFYKLC